MNRLIRSLCLACAGLLAAGLAQAETLRIGGKTYRIIDRKSVV